MKVYVLLSIELEENDTEVIGVFATRELADQSKYHFIRDYYAIEDDECADADLENEVADYLIFQTIEQDLVEA